MCVLVAGIFGVCQGYATPSVPDSVSFLAAFDADPFTSGQFKRSDAEKYRGQPWKLVSTADDGGIEGDEVREGPLVLL